ncbi:MAG: hypothetical protein ACI9KE_003135, partial [Polyangiales bacterium]
MYPSDVSALTKIVGSALEQDVRSVRPLEEQSPLDGVRFRAEGPLLAIDQ